MNFGSKERYEHYNVCSGERILRFGLDCQMEGGIIAIKKLKEKLYLLDLPVISDAIFT